MPSPGRLLILSLSLAALTGMGPAIASAGASKGKLVGFYNVKRTSFTKSNSTHLPSAGRESWRIKKGKLDRKFTHEGTDTQAPALGPLKRKGPSVFTRSELIPHEQECFKIREVKVSLRIKASKINKRAGPPPIGTNQRRPKNTFMRIKAVLTFTWADAFVNFHEIKAGSAKATYSGKFSGPLISGQTPGGPVGAEGNPWEATACFGG